MDIDVALSQLGLKDIDMQLGIKDIDMYAKIYLDVVSYKKVLTDFDYRHKGPNMGHGFKEHVNGMIIEVEGKRSKHFRSYWGVSTNPDEIEKIESSFPYDLVYFRELEVLKGSSGREFDLSGHIRRYVKNVTGILIRRKPDLVKKIWDNLDAIIQFLSDKINDLRIFSADPADPENTALVFQYISKPNTLLYLFFGLLGVIDASHELLLGLDAPLDSMPDSEQERIRNEPRLTDVVFGPRKSALSEESLRFVNLLRFQIHQRSLAKAFGRPPPPSLDEKLLLIGGSGTLHKSDKPLLTGHKSPELEMDKPLLMECSGTGYKSPEIEVDKPLMGWDKPLLIGCSGHKSLEMEVGKPLLIECSCTGHKSLEMEVDKPLIGCSGHKSLEMEVDKPLLIGCSGTGHKSLELEVDKPLLRGYESPELDKPSSPKRSKLF